MANIVYNKFKERSIRGEINLLSNTLNVALIADTYTPDADHDTYSVSVSSHEISGSGYTSGGQTLTGKVISEEDVNDRAVFTASDVSWPSSTITARWGVIYNASLGGTNDLMLLVDFGQNRSSDNGDFIIQWDSEGILTLT